VEAKTLKEGVTVTPKKEPGVQRPLAGEIEPEGPKRDSAFISEEAIERNNQELKNVADYDKLDTANKMAEEAEMELKEFADQSDLEIEAELKQADDIVKGAKEQSTLMKALARCMSIRG
jgi:hypothetical protein